MNKLEQILEESLARLASGEANLEECLSRYPEHAAELRPLLTAATTLERGQEIHPTPTFKSRTRAELMAHMRTHPRQTPVKTWTPLFSRGFGFALGQAFNAASGLAAVVVLVLGTITVLAQTALPGDALYRWKVGSEQIWRAVHLDPLETDLLLADRRVSELTSVAGNPEAEEIARQEYQQSLASLVTEYPEADAQAVISAALNEQQDSLAEAGVEVPELDRLLTTLSTREARLLLDNQVTAIGNGLITYTLTITNAGPASPISATLISQLSPLERLVSISDAACASPTGATVACTLDNLTTNRARNLSLTTAIDPCFTGTLTQTATLNGPDHLITPANNQAAAVSTITAPYPRPAQIVYAQSRGVEHDLSLIASNNRLLNADLHVRAAAPAWSPDGTRLAFSGQTGISELGGIYGQGNGVWLVEVTNAQARNPRQLVAQAHVNNIAWSPDGTKLAFEVAAPGLHHEIRVVKASDGQELGRFPGEQPAWYPDSQKLIIKSCAPDCGLWQVNLQGDNGQQITSGDTDSYPIWSPGGDYLAFSSRRDGNWEIYLLRQSDNELLRLTRRPETDTTPAFDSCGQNLYLRTDAFGSWWITVMKLDGSDERKIQADVGPSEDWGLARPAVH
ncbi:MAG: hypothetical protein DPW09_35495 [Anaerolineae bacterium]|nr:PD40 domain-containing protein [Anaerolineales bacterium]MCQ3978758.1 hypothetical protein [Anaerolineae bacterium]